MDKVTKETLWTAIREAVNASNASYWQQDQGWDTIQIETAMTNETAAWEFLKSIINNLPIEDK
jgi:rubrerythrin